MSGPRHAYLEDEDENNSCIYLQRNDDREGRELYGWWSSTCATASQGKTRTI